MDMFVWKMNSRNSQNIVWRNQLETVVAQIKQKVFFLYIRFVKDQIS